MGKCEGEDSLTGSLTIPRLPLALVLSLLWSAHHGTAEFSAHI